MLTEKTEDTPEELNAPIKKNHRALREHENLIKRRRWLRYNKNLIAPDSFIQILKIPLQNPLVVLFLKG